ncbi:MAG: peptidoglycan-binding protein [Hyphomonadaceae bacterium]|jgi:putative chitinase|nr:peptidoglycan-binding protein [Hyphomonadaceae bacterium]
MTPVTADAIKLFANHAWDGYVAAIVSGWPEIEAAGISTPLRFSHFASQFIGHEPGGLTIIRENTGWTGKRMKELWPQRFPLGAADPRIMACRGDPQKLANLAYSDRSDLGNTGGNDGWDYRGGGFSQLTGRGAFRDCGNAIGVDLEGAPELIEDPAISLRAALWVWGKDNLNQFADHNYGRTIGNAINRGNPFSKHDPIGFRDREQWFRRAWAVFGGGQPLPDEAELYLGAYGGVVRRIQGQLRDLGYGTGNQDGVYGPIMARAVAGFKADHSRALGVELDSRDVIGPLTMAAIDTAQPIALSPERKSMTMQGLAALGSTEMAAGGHMQAVGRGLTLAGGAGALHQTGALEGATGLLQQITLLQTTAAPAVKAIGWGLQNAWWVLLLAGGVYCWRSGYGVKLARLAAHQLGMNLWR